MLNLRQAIKVVCLSAMVAMSACGSLPQSNSDIDAITAKSGRIAMMTALSLTAVGFAVAATQLD